MKGDSLMRISVDSGLHPQYIADFNYNGGTFELTHEGDALIWESQWPPVRIPNISPSWERFKPDEPILRSLRRDSSESVNVGAIYSRTRR
jgi:hypothetical protein